MITRRDQAAIGVLALLSLVLGAWRCLGSEYPGLALSVPDDAYYYLLPAWNFSRIGFFTFDGLHPTFGFQPLWGLLLAGIGALCPDREVFLRAALFGGEAMHGATVVVLGLAGWRLGGRTSAAVACGLFLANLPFLRASTCGMENALYGLLLALNLLAALPVGAVSRIGASPPTPASRAVVGLLGSGLLIGLLPFARLTPGSLAATLVLGALGVRRRGWPCAIGLCGTLCAGLVAERCLLGHWFPTSGTSKLQGFVDGLWGLDLSGWLHLARSMAGYPVSQLVFGLGLPSVYGYAEKAWWCAPALLVALLAAARSLRRSSLVPLVVLAAALLASTATPLLLNRRGVELYYYVWYAVEAPVLLPVIIGAAVGGFSRFERVGAAIAAVGCAAALVTAEQPLTGLDTANDSWGTWQRAMWEAAARANVLVPAGERIGSFNAGLLGYACDRTVINLDGLANDEILGRTSIYDYVRAQRITWMIDAMPDAGWFGQDRSHFDIVETIPFQFPGFQGYFIARVNGRPPLP